MTASREMHMIKYCKDPFVENIGKMVYIDFSIIVTIAGCNIEVKFNFVFYRLNLK